MGSAVKQSQNIINHIVFVIDGSGSMAGVAGDVIRVFDAQIQHLAARSKEIEQETRVSAYLFNDYPECIIWDMDAMRTPSLKARYRTGGMTALCDAAHLAITDHQEIPQKYGDHAFLMYVLTDGQENASRSIRSQQLAATIARLPENWTLGVLVPDQNGVHEAKRHGFPAANIQLWDATSSRGVDEAVQRIQRATEGYFQARAKGVRGTKSLFNLDVAGVTPTAVKRNLEQIPPSDYDFVSVPADGPIKEFVERRLGRAYVLGSGYYQLTKPEKIQPQKQVCVQHRRDGKIYGGNAARDMLKLPDHEVKVAPVQHPDFWIFVQSTSVNRKLVAGTNLLVFK